MEVVERSADWVEARSLYTYECAPRGGHCERDVYQRTPWGGRQSTVNLSTQAPNDDTYNSQRLKESYSGIQSERIRVEEEGKNTQRNQKLERLERGLRAAEKNSEPLW
jgi:hypothetical protein